MTLLTLRDYSVQEYTIEYWQQAVALEISLSDDEIYH